MKFKRSTYLFAAGAMAFTFIAINQGAFAHENTKKNSKPMACCMEAKKTSTSAKKTSAKACCQEGATKASAKKTSAKTSAMKCCAETSKKA